MWLVYKTHAFNSINDLLYNSDIDDLDGCIVATPHDTHFFIGSLLVKEMKRRRLKNMKPLHVLMEKPMTTDIEDAINLYKLVDAESGGGSQFWINHSANYRTQTSKARDTIAAGRLGSIRHITASFAAPLKWLFLDPANEGWNKPTGNMIGNGLGWGQTSHLLAFLFHILPDLQPKNVHCRMTHSHATGADLSHSATIECVDLNSNNIVLMNISGTALLPGYQYSDPPVAKLIKIEVYGNDGSLHYSGNDCDPSSGCLEYRNADGSIVVLSDTFEFESADKENYGPESIQNFVELCCGAKFGEDFSTACANVKDGLKSVQVLDAMYRSHVSNQTEPVVSVEKQE